MSLKFVAAALLAVVSVAAHAEPAYDITFPGEAPVHVTLDGAGIASASSVDMAFNVPALSLTMQATGPNQENLSLILTRNTPVIRNFKGSHSGESLSMPGIDTLQYTQQKVLPPAQQMEVVNPKCPDSLVKIVRIDTPAESLTQ